MQDAQSTSEAINRVRQERHYLTPIEVQGIFGKSHMWLWRHAGELPAPVKIGGRRFYLVDEIAAYEQKIKAERGTQPAPKPVAVKKSKKLQLK